MKTINVFSSGDARNPSTWSNIPYCFVKQLESVGYKCHCFDISIESFGRLISWISRVWFSLMRRVHCILHPGTQFIYTFDRTPLFCWLADRRIKRLLLKNPKTCLNVVFSYSFIAKTTTVPCLLFFDWSYEFLIRDRYKRLPFLFERIYISRQNRLMRMADYVVSLFEDSAQGMMQLHNEVKIQYFNKNVVNNLNDKEMASVNAAVALKQSAHRLLFIGRSHSLIAAKQLISVVPELKKRYKELQVDIIGLTKSDFDIELPQCVSCHGFLNKGDAAQRRLYYDLMEQATCFVNTSPNWGGYSSTIESMYYYTPIVIAPYKQFQMEFGKVIDFGEYVVNQSNEALIEAIVKSLNPIGYEKRAMAAHRAVKDYTWESFTKWLIDDVIK